METEYLMELEAIWLGMGRNLEGSKRIKVGDLVAIEDGCFSTGPYATHKILGCYGDMWSNKFQIMLWDIVDCQVHLIKLI